MRLPVPSLAGGEGSRGARGAARRGGFGKLNPASLPGLGRFAASRLGGGAGLGECPARPGKPRSVGPRASAESAAPLGNQQKRAGVAREPAGTRGPSGFLWLVVREPNSVSNRPRITSLTVLYL